MMTAEIMNWTGHVLMAPRSKITELVKRPEMCKTGIYFLTGPDPETPNKTCAYIGESDNVGKRLVQHNKDESKDFWERACIVTSKDQNLTKAHARYLESRLIQIAKNVGRVSLFNNTSPDYGFLPEADIADMEYFISQIQLILPVLGLAFLRDTPQITQDNKATEQSGQSEIKLAAGTQFQLHSRKHDLTANAVEIDGDFIVLAGSQCQPQWIGVGGHNYHQLYKDLFEEKKLGLNPSGKVGVFNEDVAFTSPSAAAAMVLARASNGRTEWKVLGTRKTYADWQEEQLATLNDVVG